MLEYSAIDGVIAMLWVAIALLFAALLVELGYSSDCGLMAFLDKYREYRHIMADRVRGRQPKSIQRILEEDWRGVPVSPERFVQLWRCAARAMHIDPELMRPGDKVDDLIVPIDILTYDPSFDILEFFSGCSPSDDPMSLAQVRYETVEDMINAAIE